jgi:hypothetical protein
MMAIAEIGLETAVDLIHKGLREQVKMELMKRLQDVVDVELKSIVEQAARRLVDNVVSVAEDRLTGIINLQVSITFKEPKGE